MKRTRSTLLAISMLITASNQALAQDGSVDADALAKELANPGGALSSLTSKFEYRWYAGDLPGADNQNAGTYTFQPVLPFPTDSGDTIIVRPAFSAQLEKPYFDAVGGDFDNATAFDDISFDLLYSFGNIDPWVFGVGLVGSIPTGTNDRVTAHEWTLGPEFLLAHKFDWGIVGFLAFHNWDIENQGDLINTTSVQPFLAYSLGDGVTIGPSGTITYNWNAASGSEWTVPVGVNIGKTASANGQPIKYGLSVEYNAVRPDAFAPEWKVSFSIAPVVQNPFLR